MRYIKPSHFGIIITLLIGVQTIAILLSLTLKSVSQKVFVEKPIETSNQTVSDVKEPSAANLYRNKLPVLQEDKEKKEEIKNEFLFAWNNYNKNAWGYDFYDPISHRGHNVFNGALMIVDSLDTIVIMGLDKEYEKSKEWIKNSYKLSGTYSVFEIIIRLLGSFIALYQMKKDQMFLDKAIEIADHVLSLCNEDGFYPRLARFEYKDGKSYVYPASGSQIILADIGTMQMEFYTLSMMTCQEKYAKAANKIYNRLFTLYPNDGLYPQYLNRKGHSMDNTRSVDSLSDSYYEYLMKIYILTNGTQDVFLEKYLKTADDIENRLLAEFKDNDKTYKFLGRLRPNGHLERAMSHLVTFIPGLLTIGTVKQNPRSKEHLLLADELVNTYCHLYSYTKTGLMPEVISINDNSVREIDSKYKLRPETVESLFVLYRFTGDKKYRDKAWEIFQAIKKNCKIESGYLENGNVNADPPVHSDVMDSYFLAETFKYLYLIFSSSDVIPNDKYVFNTEAHPFHVWKEEECEKMKDIIGFYKK